MSDLSSSPDATIPDATALEVSETTGTEPQTDEEEQKELPPAGHIRNVGMLDLRSAKTPEDLNGIIGISDVGCVLVPEHLAARLAQIPTSGIGSIIPIPPGNVNCLIGQIWLTGEALAAGDPNVILMIIGQAFLKTPITAVGYKEIHVYGQVMALRGSETALGAKLASMNGQVFYLPAKARTIMGEETIGREFLDLLPEPSSLVVMGVLTFDDDVSVELLKAKVPEVVLMGEICAPSTLLPLLQVLTVEKMGRIYAKE